MFAPTAETFRQFLEQQDFFVFILDDLRRRRADRQRSPRERAADLPVEAADADRLHFRQGRGAVRRSCCSSRWCRRSCCSSSQVLFAGSFVFLKKNLFLFPAITVATLLQGLLTTFTMLALSSLSKSSRYVGILYAGILFFTAAIYGAMLAITGSTRLSWISLTRQPDAGRRRDLQAAAALRDALAGVPDRHSRAHRALDLGARAAGARRGGGHVSVPIVTAEHVSKWYGQVIGLNDVTVECAARDHRPARPERRRQVDVHEADHRSAQTEQGGRQGARRADLATTRTCIFRSGSVPSRMRSTSA